MADNRSIIQKLRDEIRGSKSNGSPTGSMSTAEQIRYKRLENQWAEAQAVGDPGAENKEEWIRLRMHGG